MHAFKLGTGIQIWITVELREISELHTVEEEDSPSRTPSVACPDRRGWSSIFMPSSMMHVSDCSPVERRSSDTRPVAISIRTPSDRTRKSPKMWPRAADRGGGGGDGTCWNRFEFRITASSLQGGEETRKWTLTEAQEVVVAASQQVYWKSPMSRRSAERQTANNWTVTCYDQKWGSLSSLPPADGREAGEGGSRNNCFVNEERKIVAKVDNKSKDRRV